MSKTHYIKDKNVTELKQGEKYVLNENLQKEKMAIKKDSVAECIKTDYSCAIAFFRTSDGSIFEMPFSEADLYLKPFIL